MRRETEEGKGGASRAETQDNRRKTREKRASAADRLLIWRERERERGKSRRTAVAEKRLVFPEGRRRRRRRRERGVLVVLLLLPASALLLLLPRRRRRRRGEKAADSFAPGVEVSSSSLPIPHNFFFHPAARLASMGERKEKRGSTKNPFSFSAIV